MSTRVDDVTSRFADDLCAVFEYLCFLFES